MSAKKKQLKLTDQQADFLFHHFFKNKIKLPFEHFANIILINRKFAQKFSEHKAVRWKLRLELDSSYLDLFFIRSIQVCFKNINLFNVILDLLLL